MYDNVFSKNEKFKPTYSESVYNALLYLGFKAKTASKLDAFIVAFSGVNVSAISEPFVPYIIKLSTWYDKKFNTKLTVKVISEFNAFLSVLSKNFNLLELENFIKQQ